MAHANADLTRIKSRKAPLLEEERRVQVWDLMRSRRIQLLTLKPQNQTFWKGTGKKKALSFIWMKPEDSEDEGKSLTVGDTFYPDPEPTLFSFSPVPFSDDVGSDSGSEAGFHVVEFTTQI